MVHGMEGELGAHTVTQLALSGLIAVKLSSQPFPFCTFVSCDKACKWQELWLNTPITFNDKIGAIRINHTYT